MKTLEINVQEPYYSFLLSGEKTIEGRLNKGKFATVQVGDILLLGEEKIPFRIATIRNYPTFSKMLENEGVSSIIPDKKSLEEAVAVYHSFYTPQQEREFGVVALAVEKI